MTSQGGQRGRLTKLLLAFTGLPLLGFLTVAFLSSAPAHAAGRLASDTTCPTAAYSPDDTIQSCNTTTTAAVSSNLQLTISYSDGYVHWQVCGFVSSGVGTTVQLYLDGQLQTEPGGTGTVQPGGCTNVPEIYVCDLKPNHTYTAAAVDQPYGEADSTVATGSLPCSERVAAASAGAPANAGSSDHAGNSGSGSLAFTGANIILLVAAAIAAVLVGNAIVRLSRQRGQARR
jgi:hypothetical protein